MDIRQRHFERDADLRSALALADNAALGVPHLADWPYRFASWALDTPLNAQVWLDDDDQLLGWVVMQTPFWAIDCQLGPDAPPSLYREMLLWAQARARAMAGQGEGRPMWFVSIAASCHAQCRELAALGFEDQAEAAEDPWSKVLFAIDHDVRAPSPLPEGLAIRSLNPATEIQAYVELHRAVFQSESMTNGWRARATQMADYRNELDLVLVTDSGELCGFCVAWLRHTASGEVVGQIEPLGIAAPYRGQRLSQPLLAEAVRRLRSQGAGRVVVETDRQRKAAMTAYTSMGFQVAEDVRVYRYLVSSQS